MRSPEFAHPKASVAHEKKSHIGALAFAAIMSAACEKIPQGPPSPTYERIIATGAPQTADGVLNLTLPSPIEGQPHASVESSVLSFDGNRGPETNIGRFTELARAHYGQQIKDTGTAGAYLNYVVIPFHAEYPEYLNRRLVQVTYDFVRTDVVDSHLRRGDSARQGALISQRLQLHKMGDQALPAGNGPVLRQQAAVAHDYTTALGMALNQIIAPPERSAEIQADFERQRAAGRAEHDSNQGARCGTITSDNMTTSFYCQTSYHRELTLVIENILVVQETAQGQTPSAVRVSVLYREPGATATNVLAIPGI